MDDAIDSPSLEEVLEDVFDSRAEEIHTWFPGRSVASSWDEETFTVNVEPMVTLPRPISVLPKVPVAFGAAYWEVMSASTGIVLVGEANWKQWWRSGEPSSPEESGRHDPAYAVFLPFLWDSTNIPDIDTLDTVLPNINREVAVGPGWLKLGKWDGEEQVVRGNRLAEAMGGAGGFLQIMTSWATGLEAATGVPAAAINAAIADLTFALYTSCLSEHVKVDSREGGA